MRPLLRCTPVAAAVLTSLSQTAHGDELSELRLQLERQQGIMEAQQRQIESQEARLQEQQRLLAELAARAGMAVPAQAQGSGPAPGTTAAAIPEPSPVRADTPSVGTRFAGVDVTVGGALRTTVTTTTARMQPDATPFLVLPPVPGLPDGTTKFDARLSSLMLSIKGHELGGFQIGGLIYAYLFDGNLFSGQYGVYPGIAYVDAKDERWRFAVGLQQDVFSPMIPTMVDRMSAFAGSGNAGNSFKTQLRAERYFRSEADQWVLQVALADALPSNIEPGFANSTENAGVPNAEVRFAWTRGDGDDALLKWPRWSLGLSGATGKFRTIYDIGSDASDVRLRSYETTLGGLALEAGVRLTDCFGLQGEYYAGRALGPYLGAIFQTTNSVTREAISSDGFWTEAAWYWNPKFHSHLGYGRDEADPEDLAALQSNETAFLNLFWEPSAMTTLGIETTWRRTGYLGGIDNDGYALMLSSELRF